MRTSTTCEKIIIRLIRTIKAYGYPTNLAGPGLQRQMLPFEENMVVASQEFIVKIAPGTKQPDYSQKIQMFFDDIIGTSKTAISQKFKQERRPHKQPYKPEDLTFATQSMQPSTVGQIFNCLYTVVVNRTIKGFANYPTGVSVLMTVNPCQA